LATDSRRLPDPAEDRRRRLRSAWLPLVRWLLAVATTTALLRSVRDALDEAHMALAFLLVVLAGSARHGRRLGLALSVIGFLCFNFFLLQPYHTFVVADPLDWGVLVAFLVTGGVAAQLLYRAQREAAIAHQRAEEIDRLSTLGAETLNAGRAEDAVEAIARVIRSTLRVASCEIHLRDPATGATRCVGRARSGHPVPSAITDPLPAEVVGGGAVAGNGAAGFAEAVRAYPAARVLLFPLRVRGRDIGLLRLADHEPIRLDAPQARFAEVLSYYAALGVERIQLVAEAEHVEALREADRLREALVAGVSHDLRTPLTTIKALAHEMRATGDERAVAIEEEADRLNALVVNLLDLSRLNAGAVPLSPEVIVAEDLLGAALQRVAGAQGGRELVTSVSAEETLPGGRFDFVHSLRALVNLLENALKYSPSHTPVEVRTGREGAFLAFAVLDRGPGIAAAEVDRIFEPFYRMPDREPDVAGTGLGLSIARRLAEAQGGAVRYEARPGGGSVFTLLLPAVDLTDLAMMD
jgi:two-component system, OmpR family, sensor histidine kinase KdpD